MGQPEWSLGVEPADDSVPKFGKTLNGSILVPFPVESCLSGVAPGSSDEVVQKFWYRLTFDAQTMNGSKTLLHFGAVDWQSTIYLNGEMLGGNTGGYNGFSFEVELMERNNELLVYVYDPSDAGSQPNGKQRISAISQPGGDTYTPSSGIWQTVWMESVPSAYVKDVKIDQSDALGGILKVAVTTNVDSSENPIGVQVFDGATQVGEGVAYASGEIVSLKIENPRLWSPGDPFLYDVYISMRDDEVVAYAGLRTYAAETSSKGYTRAKLNGNFTFFAGFLRKARWIKR